MTWVWLGLGVGLGVWPVWGQTGGGVLGQAGRELVGVMGARDPGAALVVEGRRISLAMVEGYLRAGQPEDLARQLWPALELTDGVDLLFSWYASVGTGDYREDGYIRPDRGRARPPVHIYWSGGKWLTGPVMPHGEAARAGLRAGEEVRAVDGQPLPKERWEVVRGEALLEGPEGSACVLVMGDGRQVTVTRRRQQPRAVLDGQVVRLPAFYDGVSLELLELLTMVRPGPWELDLRDVPGGWIGEALVLIKALAENEPGQRRAILYWRPADSRTPSARADWRKQEFANSQGRRGPLPSVSDLTVRINGRTSSAAELLAGGLAQLGARVEGGLTQGKRVALRGKGLANGGVALTAIQVWSFTAAN